MIDLDHVLARFPRRANDIRRLYLCDANFRSICEDLALAQLSLSGGSGERIAGEAARELRLLRDDLESELLACLARVPQTHRSKG